jgi:class 3 adenylate cyclase
VVVDVADFTNPVRTRSHQLAIHEGLYDVLRNAFAESGISWSSCTTEDRGDGAMILLPATVPKIALVDMFPDRLVAGLLRYNLLRNRAATVQLRVGLHFGEVANDANGVVSPAVNFAFRILDADAARSALETSGGVVAFIASENFYQDVIAQDPAAHPTAYRKIPVDVKNLSTQAWLRLAEIGAADPAPINLETPAVRAAPDPVLALWQPEELDHVSALLSGVTVAHLPTIVRRAAGPSMPIPTTGNAWEVFVELMDINAGPDGVPPALYFLELLAEQVEADLRTQLTDWVANQVLRLGLDAAMRDRRKLAVPVPSEPLLHLMIAAEPDAIDPRRYRLSCWRQDDPDAWPPNRIGLGEVAEAELERAVDRLVVDAEEQWADQDIHVALEFLFPVELFHLPVHRWFKEHDSGSPRPLIFDYPIVLRSLERMRMRQWHRPWRERWRILKDDPSASRVYFCGPSDTDEPFGIDLALSDRLWVSVVSSTEPEREPGRAELTAALQSGIPVLIWHSWATPDELRMVIEELLEDGGLADLPARTQAARRETFLPFSARSNVNITQHLVLLWDDPTRTVAVGLPSTRALP